MTKQNLHIGGLVAVGFDSTGRNLLTVSHTGRGVFSTSTWERLARSTDIAYPECGVVAGVGPIQDQAIAVVEIDSSTECLRLPTPDQKFLLLCESSGIEVVPIGR